jgi:phosphopantothenoylcysteine decarboxylase/phosphopantothenate--cysteine ligase
MKNDILSSKKIILGVTGCIAAYKSCFIVRELVKHGAEVKVVMTNSALEFITPLSLSTLSHNPVIVNIFPESQKDGTDLSTWHIDLATWADLMIIAPATINTVAKIAHGFADNALTTLVTALRCPLIISPAADVDMYENKITRENITKLESLGYYIIPAESGELASGIWGAGRLADTGKIIDYIEVVLSGIKKDLRDRKILVTAGPTYEDIDPVRFIGNRSSGKMGFAIAKAAWLRGADVTLITGPTSECAYPEIKSINVRSAQQMKSAVDKEIKSNDVLIMSAAVADFKPAVTANKKIKKEQKINEIKLVNTLDILSTIKKDNKIFVGFALETENEKANAKKKLTNKKLDMIVMNSLKDKKSGFDFDTNKISVIHKSGSTKNFPLLSKFQTANNILTELKKYF